MQNFLDPFATSSRRELVEQAFASVGKKNGQSKLVFTKLYQESARLAADTADSMKRVGVQLPPLAGWPISIKDLFDVQGETTTAGSAAVRDLSPASVDAVVVRRLRRAGAAIVGKTNMTEFAFSGLGLNPHYGTPLNTWDRSAGRIPGGSSSGAAISITDGMAVAALGTDTGGSCRIPAAFNGIVGFKPSAPTVPLTGAFALSKSFDSIGPLAASVDICARVYEAISLQEMGSEIGNLRQLTFGLPSNYVLEDMDADVSEAFEEALLKMSRAGVRLAEFSMAAFDRLPALLKNGGIVAAEAFHRHRDLINSRGCEYDPRVLVRINRGAQSTAADYIELLNSRQEYIKAWHAEAEPFDALIMPTVPIVAPLLRDLEDDDEAYNRINLLALRNPTTVNASDGCSISIPCHSPGMAPVGLMITCTNGQDRRLLSIARAVEALFTPRSSK
ncbi:amidase [Rhizobium sp. 2YAF20]|uniref:amidase n=1 Tax=Rhizobium sp. 2YAF20 TaxID=3233027 RepID=UPI003F9C2BDB